MNEVVIVGLGPGPVEYLTREAENVLLAQEKIFFRLKGDPVYVWLEGQGKSVSSFNALYSVERMSAVKRYKFMADIVANEASRSGRACLAVPGNPGVLEDTTTILRGRAKKGQFDLRIVPGMSFLELIYSETGIDPFGLQHVLPRTHVQHNAYTPQLGMLIAQPFFEGEDEKIPESLMTWLLETYPGSHPVTLIWTNGPPHFRNAWREVRLDALTEISGEDVYFASLYLPPLPGKN